MLLASHERRGFLHRIVTGDEKWIHYDNPKRKKSWGPPGHASTSTANPNIHGRKLLLSIWWDQLSVVYYELLKPSKTITGAVYRTQLLRMSRALKEKRAHCYSRHDKVILLHDNARPHVSVPVKTYLETLKCKVLPHPPYSPDIARSDFHLFRSMTPVWVAVNIIWKYQKLCQFVDSLKKWSILPTWYPYVSQKSMYVCMYVCIYSIHSGRRP